MQMVLAAAGFTHDEHARTRPPLLSTVSMCFQSSAGNGVYVIPTRPLPTPSFAHSIFCSLHLLLTPSFASLHLLLAPHRTAPHRSPHRFAGTPSPRRPATCGRGRTSLSRWGSLSPPGRACSTSTSGPWGCGSAGRSGPCSRPCAWSTATTG